MNRPRLAAIPLAVLLCATAAAADHAAWLAKVEGFYSSDRNKTPFGEIPFAMDMVKQADGSLHGRTWGDSQTYFDFKFYRNEKGDLLFQETGALPGGFVQSHVCEVVKVEGDTITFETKKEPGLLVARVTADGNRLHVNTIVRGKPHADLVMMRGRDEKAIAGFRAANARAKEQAAGSSLQQALGAAAQQQVDSGVSKPEQARQHVAEARKLTAQFATAAPGDIPGLAYKMKGHLDKAGELDPANDEAQLQMAVWYLHAPEIAGGSRAKAEEILQLLEKQNSPRAEPLRKQLAARR